MMGVYTNEPNKSANLLDTIKECLISSHSATLATGYVSRDVIEGTSDLLVGVSKKGNATLIVGMARYGGMSNSQFGSLKLLNSRILKENPSSGGVKFVYNPKPYHGKIFSFETFSGNRLFAGSSNYSASGFGDHLEFSLEITDLDLKQETIRYLDWLDSGDQSLNLDNFADIEIQKNSELSFPEPGVGDRNFVTKPTIEKPVSIDIPIRVGRQTRSGLNTFFGKGRLTRSTGRIIPRSWFEVEIISNLQITNHPNYPQGDFLVRTSEGSFECRTQGDYYKNLRSKNDLKILGGFIKGRLQRAGCLVYPELVTDETLTDYGRDCISLTQIGQSEYWMDF